ncbi:MAG: hypothetical protein WC030_03545 [Candidatus Paceibacterota bacterium]
MSIVDTAYNKAGLDEDEAQRINDTPGLAELIASFIGDNRNDSKYKDEEVESNCGYLSGYTKPRPLAEQAARLRELFPGIELTYDETERPVPAGAEGNFLILNWHAIALTYVEAVQIVFAKLKETRDNAFINYRENEMTSANLHETARKGEAMATLRLKQRHNLLVVAAQFGLRHAGRSMRRARVVIGGKGFGLGAFEIGVMLLTHPERVAHYDDLWVDCPGDEFKPSDKSAFGYAPYFFCDGGGLAFHVFEDGVESDHSGSASGSVP